MGDGGILSALGYRSMWPKLKDMPADAGIINQSMQSKVLQFCCEKRIPNGTKKIWIGQYCSMAMAAHAYDLCVEAFSWKETPLHYGRSDFLRRKVEDLLAELGPNYNLDDPVSRKKITDHAFNYAKLFPCSDSLDTLKKCLLLWVAQKGEGPTCIIHIEIPCLPGNEHADRSYYAPSLLPPMAMPDSLRGNEINRPADSGPMHSSSKIKNCPSHVVGTNDLENDMGVDPDLMSCFIVNERGGMKNKSFIPCIYQQWTWCTRTPDERQQRQWNPVHQPPRTDPSTTTFREKPTFITDPWPPLRFSLLNYQVYEKAFTRRKRKQPPPWDCPWHDTEIDEHIDEHTEVHGIS